MSEYTEVEQPFLHQLQALGWEIIDQGQEIPADPARSPRANFRQWLNSSLIPIFAPDTGSGMFSSCSLVTPSLTMDLFKGYIQSYN